MDLQKIKAA